MRKWLAIGAIWIVLLCWLLSESFAQTTNINGVQYIRVDTNAPAVPTAAVPLNDRIREWSDAAQNFALGVGAVLLTIAGIWISLKAKLAEALKIKAAESDTINKVLIHEVQKVATKNFKDTIASAARDAGVGDALHAMVKENTPSAPPSQPRDFAAELVAAGISLPDPPVVPIENPHDTKPI